GLDTPKSSLANASDLKKSDRDQHQAEIGRIRAQGLAGDDERRAIAAFEGAWATGEAERKRRYIPKGPAEALDALADIVPPAIIHAGRDRRRHRLQQGGISRNRRARPRRIPHHRGADRGKRARLEGI